MVMGMDRGCFRGSKSWYGIRGLLLREKGAGGAGRRRRCMLKSGIDSRWGHQFLMCGVFVLLFVRNNLICT